MAESHPLWTVGGGEHPLFTLHVLCTHTHPPPHEHRQRLRVWEVWGTFWRVCVNAP